MTNNTSLALRTGPLVASSLDYILVDGSGSMRVPWWDFLAALDGFMDTMKTHNIHSHGIVSVFDDHDLSLIQRNGLIRDWKTFSSDPLGAHWGGTPLYDAINTAGRHIRDLKPDKCSIVIVTDGEEGDSKFTTLDQAAAIIRWMRANGWQVTFLGCDFNNDEQARRLGMDEHCAIGVQRKLLGAAGKLLGEKRAKHERTGDDINFSDAERTKFGGYLVGPTKD